MCFDPEGLEFPVIGDTEVGIYGVENDALLGVFGV